MHKTISFTVVAYTLLLQQETLITQPPDGLLIWREIVSFEGENIRNSGKYSNLGGKSSFF